MLDEPKDLICAELSVHGAQKSSCLTIQLLRVSHLLCVMIGLLALSGTALAQVEPALPGSIEYGLLTNNYTWFQTSDSITVGIYVEDLLTDRLNQPAGRGEIGRVTATGWDADYNEMAAVVDFGRDYSAGIVFPELTAVQVVPIPEPSSPLILVSGVLLVRTVWSRTRRAKPNS